VTDASNTKREYKYNGHGQRVKKVVYTQRGKKVENEVTTIFHYNLAGQLIGESDETGAMIAEYVYLNNQPLAKIEGASTYFYVNDHLATPQKMMDAAGTVVWSADYKPFGEANVNVSTITNNLRFPGQYFDAETGLHYNYFRDYNPVIGRYIEADPIGLAGGINLYSYVLNNPINWVDPMGLKTYRCRRPLAAMGGSGQRSGPDISVNPLFHQYLCVEKNGVMTCGGQTSQNGRLYGPGAPSNDVFDESSCEIIGINRCIDDCLLDRFNNQRPYYGLAGPGTNCQEWSDDQFQSCLKSCF
jgi:RHS repeat-associated protein